MISNIAYNKLPNTASNKIGDTLNRLSCPNITIRNPIPISNKGMK